LPVKKGRQTRLKLLAEETRTMIFYESPHKLIKTLGHFCMYFGDDRLVSVSRELTKLYEETTRGTAKDVLNYYTNKPPKGEIVIIVGGKTK
jgi:16S rRNA (cytidine1402-2'-O)-methyltransferase